MYRAQYGLPACTTANGCFKKVNQNGVQGSYPRDDTGWAQESALDLDMASAMCPGCKIDPGRSQYAELCQPRGCGPHRGRAPARRVISNSYGGSESGTSSYEAPTTSPARPSRSRPATAATASQFPASSPHVIAVGGTHLSRASNSRGWSETAWSSGGSGCSTVYAKPSFQTDAAVHQAHGSRRFGGRRSEHRRCGLWSDQPRTFGWMVFGGTSVSAPLIGGIYGVTGHSPSGASQHLRQQGLAQRRHQRHQRQLRRHLLLHRRRRLRWPDRPRHAEWNRALLNRHV